MSGLPPSPLLALRGIGKSFLGVRVLDGVDLQVRPGEVHAVVGENGGRQVHAHEGGVRRPPARRGNG